MELSPSQVIVLATPVFLLLIAVEYAWGVARNHPFVDGNKRSAAVVSETFLMLNGYRLTATDAELVVAMFTLAAADLSEADLADWFRQHLA